MISQLGQAAAPQKTGDISSQPRDDSGVALAGTPHHRALDTEHSIKGGDVYKKKGLYHLSSL